MFNPLNDELNPICHLLALLGGHCILHVSRIRVKESVDNVFVFLFTLHPLPHC
jgi:hypothetical protein